MPSHHISATHLSGQAFKTEFAGHTINIDLPVSSGGNDIGPSPKALMLISLAGCTGLDVIMILDKMRVKYSDFKIEIEGLLTDTQPKTYHTVFISYSIKIAEKDRPNMEKAVNLSQDKYCGVSAMFRSFAKLESKIVWI